jgi:DNA polymerase-3 subunit delta'
VKPKIKVKGKSIIFSSLCFTEKRGKLITSNQTLRATMGFDELFGNKRIKHILTSYLRNNIVPYSMIFSGPGSSNLPGFALAFAKALNCLNKNDDFCDECQHCIEASHDSFLDLRVLYPDGQFYKKEQITLVVEDNPRKPLKGDKKIYILTDAHHMNPSSANAFLKVLEEPAPSNVFILLTNNLDGLLPTIKSRCQILKFSPLSRKEIKEYFIKQGDDAETARLKAYLSQSNMESVLTSDFKEFMKKRAQVLAALTSLLQNRGVETILMDLYKRSRSREKFVEYFRELVNSLSLMLRDILILLIDPQNQQIINVDYKENLMTLSRTITIEKTLFLIRKMEYLLRDIQRNLNTKVLILEFMKSYTGEVYDV